MSDFSSRMNLPCVGCGYCCIMCQCSYSMKKYGDIDHCPDLYWDESRYKCRMLPDNKELANDIKLGTYCHLLTDWRLDVRPRQYEDTWTVKFGSDIEERIIAHAEQFK